MKLNTNEQELVEIAVNGSVDHPRMRGFYTGYDGKGRRCVGTGGITYSHAIGDNCMQVAGDHVEPGVSLRNPEDGRNHALETLACVGNPAKIIKYRFDDKRIKELLEEKWWDKIILDINSQQRRDDFL